MLFKLKIIGQIIKGFLVDFSILPDGFLGFVKANGQNDFVQISRFSENLMCQNSEITSIFCENIAHHQAIENTIRVIGNQDKGGGLRDRVERARDQVQ